MFLYPFLISSFVSVIIFVSPLIQKVSEQYQASDFENVFVTPEEYLPPERKLEEIEEEEAYRMEKIIKDYEVIMFLNGGRGTGWILDFELKDDIWKYPTKWFFATNYHVVSRFNFPDGNSKNSRKSKGISVKNDNTINSVGKFLIAKDHSPEYDKMPLWEIPSKWNKVDPSYVAKDKWEIVDASKPYTKPKPGIINVYAAEIEKPKLFYSSIDFLNTRPSYLTEKLFPNNTSYYKDFAIVEVNFDSPSIAKLVTKNFYRKYYLNHKFEDHLKKKTSLTTKESDALNYFRQINKRYKKLDFFNNVQDRISKEDKKWTEIPYENYFSAGYSANAYMTYQAFGNYSPISKHSLAPNYERRCKNVNGLGDQPFKDKKVKLIGCNWSMVNSWLGKGSSGSLVTDKNGNVVGLFRAVKNLAIDGTKNYENSIASIEPIRAHKLVNDKNEEYSPEYDLIEGVSGQRDSYRSKLLSEYPNINTFMKELRKWKKNSDQP
ncbi:MIP family Ig-specific serine endopeptidase [Candidatus Mycoplasma haematohominis]|uniref:MIP family Ig-specific serine endopeptidase n=1 Tax=Candidatus Mycoplasma haematohominis TaxID=1494318 RepID=UPI001C0A7099|nr:DUF31 family protein [Candidatus Mycoplasma haemohominis]